MAAKTPRSAVSAHLATETRIEVTPLSNAPRPAPLACPQPQVLPHASAPASREVATEDTIGTSGRVADARAILRLAEREGRWDTNETGKRHLTTRLGSLTTTGAPQGRGARVRRPPVRTGLLLTPPAATIATTGTGASARTGRLEVVGLPFVPTRMIGRVSVAPSPSVTCVPPHLDAGVRAVVEALLTADVLRQQTTVHAAPIAQEAAGTPQSMDRTATRVAQLAPAAVPHEPAPAVRSSQARLFGDALADARCRLGLGQEP